MAPFSSRDLIVLYSRSISTFTKRLHYRYLHRTSRSPSSSSSTSIISAFLLALAVSILLLTYYHPYLYYTLLHLFDPYSASPPTVYGAAAAVAPIDLPPHLSLNVWYRSTQCTAHNLTTSPSRYSHNGFPSVVLRDVAVDTRPSMHVFYNTSSTNTLRLLLCFTVHNSARLSKSQSSIQFLINHQLKLSNVPVSVSLDYVLHSTAFLLRKAHMHYVPGTRTVHGRQVSEWQAGVSLHFVSSTHLSAFVTNQSHSDHAHMSLALHLSVLRYHRGAFVASFFHPSFSLPCITGFSATHLLPHVTNQHHPMSCMKSSTSVLLSNNPLYGRKRTHAKYYAEIAHFALRALTGPIRYDAVVMGVAAPLSHSDIMYMCDDALQNANVNANANDKCHARTNEVLNDIANAVTKHIIDIVRNNTLAYQLLPRISIVPVCTLGSDAARSERFVPCAQSKHFGQYWAPSLLYAAFTRGHKWAASYDMDEFFSFVPSSTLKHVKRARAATIFDKSKSAHLVAQWMNLKIGSYNEDDDAKTLTNIVATNHIPALSNKYDAAKSTSCYDVLADDTGKAAVRCDVGMGFSIHHAVVISGTKPSTKGKSHGKGNQSVVLAFQQGAKVDRMFRTWHARYDVSKGPCEFKASNGALASFRMGDEEDEGRVDWM